MTQNAKGRPPGEVSAPETAQANGDTKSITALVPIQGRRNGTCWRCGTPFAWTDLAVLRYCAELARQGRTHPRPLRFEDIPREDW
jgi:hypothetical protein